MAHMEKLQGGNAYGLMIIHNDRNREDPEHERTRENSNIDPERSKYNYDLIGRADPYQYYKDRHEELDKERYEQTGQHLRKDAVRLCSLIVYLPEDLENRGDAFQRNFFKGCVDYASAQFGDKNIIQAMVHRDENRDHIHILAIPCTKEPDRSGRQYERVSFKEAFNREDFRNMHPLLQEHIRNRTRDRDIKIYDEEHAKRRTVSKSEYIRMKEEEREKEHALKLERKDKEEIRRAKEKSPEVKTDRKGRASAEEVERLKNHIEKLTVTAERSQERAERAEDEKTRFYSIREMALNERLQQASAENRELKEQVQEHEKDRRFLDYLRNNYDLREAEKNFEREERQHEKHHERSPER